MTNGFCHLRSIDVNLQLMTSQLRLMQPTVHVHMRMLFAAYSCGLQLAGTWEWSNHGSLTSKLKQDLFSPSFWKLEDRTQPIQPTVTKVEPALRTFNLSTRKWLIMCCKCGANPSITNPVCFVSSGEWNAKKAMFMPLFVLLTFFRLTKRNTQFVIWLTPPIPNCSNFLLEGSWCRAYSVKPLFTSTTTCLVWHHSSENKVGLRNCKLWVMPQILWHFITQLLYCTFFPKICVINYHAFLSEDLSEDLIGLIWFFWLRNSDFEQATTNQIDQPCDNSSDKFITQLFHHTICHSIFMRTLSQVLSQDS